MKLYIKKGVNGEKRKEDLSHPVGSRDKVRDA